MDNIESVHKWLHLYLVILFLLFVSRILAFNFMLMSVKIRRYRAIIISSSSISICNDYPVSDIFNIGVKFSRWGKNSQGGVKTH